MHTDEDLISDWKTWRAGWEGFLTIPHGWLSAVDLNWLSDSPQAQPGLPGLWWQSGNALMIDPAGTTMSFEGESFTTTRRLELAISEDDSRITVGDLEVGITYRGTYMIVTYDPRAPQRLEFSGVPTFEPGPAWVVHGKLERFETPKSVVLDSVGGFDNAHESPGVVRFEYGGAEHTLQAVVSHGMLVVVFTDATSGVTTYPACRSLQVTGPDTDNAVTLDFNRSLNMPCAFSGNFPMCPVPPPGNRLSFAVEAGEKNPH